MPRMGLTADKVVAAAAELADRDGYDALLLATLADELGVRVPSLYKHIGGVDDLQRQVAELGAAGLSAAVSEASSAKLAREALVAAATAYRRFVRTHPGRYLALTRVRGVDLSALELVLTRIARDYGLAGDACGYAAIAIHSALAGFVGLQVDTDPDAAFFEVIAVLDRGLSADAPHARRGLRIPGLGNLPGLPNLAGLPSLPGFGPHPK